MALSIYSKILEAISKHNLCRCGDCLIVGVSGGADSVALLDILITLPGFFLKLVVAHLNHLLRGKESDVDEQFVAELATRYQLACEIRRVDVQQLAIESRTSLEEAGRMARYNFFDELRTKYRASGIAVAHHADDQAETFLMRLLRGAGTTGLASIRPINKSGVIRPLLEITRQELRDYLQIRGITFREDASNADCNYLRNKIRHELIPVLKGFNPAITMQLTNTASLLQEDEELLAASTISYFRQLAKTGNGWVSFSRQYLLQQCHGLRTRLYRHAIEQLQGNLQRIERQHLLLLDRCLLTNTTGSSLNLPGLLVGLLTSDNLLIASQKKLYPASPRCISITGPGNYNLGNGLSLRIEESAMPLEWQDIPDTDACINLQLAPFPWQVRPFRPGERIDLTGTNGSKKIQDILTDRKVPRHLRQALPLICHKTDLLWLAGVYRSRHAALTSDCSSIMRIRLCGTENLPL